MIPALEWAKAYWRLGGIRTPTPSAPQTVRLTLRAFAEETETDFSALAGLGEPPTLEAMLAFNAVWPLVERSVNYFARVITKDMDEREDLIQEAMIALWKADSTRFDFRNPKDLAYIRRCLINRMWDAWETEPGRFRSREAGGMAEDVRRSVGGRDMMQADRMSVSHGREE